jgi:hypothetical protein
MRRLHVDLAWVVEAPVAEGFAVVCRGCAESDDGSNLWSQTLGNARRGPRKGGFNKPNHESRKSPTEQAAGDEAGTAGARASGRACRVIHVAGWPTPAIMPRSAPP